MIFLSYFGEKYFKTLQLKIDQETKVNIFNIVYRRIGLLCGSKNNSTS